MPRNFAVPEWALEVLRAHRAEHERDKQLYGPGYQDHNLIFCQPQGGYYSPDRIGARIVELMRKAGLSGVSTHSLRHSHASHLLSKGVPIAVVSERLGHADQNITLSIYSHSLPADTQAAAKVWNDAMVEVISDARKPAAPRVLASVSAQKPFLKHVTQNKRQRMAGTTGLEPATSAVTSIVLTRRHLLVVLRNSKLKSCAGASFATAHGRPPWFWTIERQIESPMPMEPSDRLHSCRFSPHIKSKY
jgi:Phage integrase family